MHVFNLFLLYICISRSKDGGGYDQLGEFDQALFLYLDGHDNPSSSSAAQDQRREYSSDALS